MEQTCTEFWNAIIEQCGIMMEKDKLLVMYTDSETLFHQNFDYYYSLIVDKFMKIKDDCLDRHKVAAVAICAILKSNILGVACGKNTTQTMDDMFLANEKLALNVALSDMYQKLIDEFESGKIPYETIPDEFIFPKPLSCDREYAEVMCRDLYFAKKYFELNPVSIANFLFLIEAYSFQVSNISINVEKWNQLNNIRRKEQWKKELDKIEMSLSGLDERVANQRAELERQKTELENRLKELEETK